MLLQAAFNYKERGLDTLLFIPEIVGETLNGSISSRIRFSEKATNFSEGFDFFSHIKKQVEQQKSNIFCILVDEAQFLKKAQVRQLTQVVDELNLPVLTYGIRSDFKGEPFEGSKYLMSWEEDMIEPKEGCHCGKKDIMKWRHCKTGEPGR